MAAIGFSLPVIVAGSHITTAEGYIDYDPKGVLNFAAKESRKQKLLKVTMKNPQYHSTDGTDTEGVLRVVAASDVTTAQGTLSSGPKLFAITYNFTRNPPDIHNLRSLLQQIKNDPKDQQDPSAPADGPKVSKHGAEAELTNVNKNLHITSQTSMQDLLRSMGVHCNASFKVPVIKSLDEIVDPRLSPINRIYIELGKYKPVTLDASSTTARYCRNYNSFAFTLDDLTLSKIFSITRQDSVSDVETIGNEALKGAYTSLLDLVSEYSFANTTKASTGPVRVIPDDSQVSFWRPVQHDAMPSFFNDKGHNGDYRYHSPANPSKQAESTRPYVDAGAISTNIPPSLDDAEGSKAYPSVIGKLRPGFSEEGTQDTQGVQSSKIRSFYQGGNILESRFHK